MREGRNNSSDEAQRSEELIQQVDLLRSILDSLSEGVTVADAKGHLILFNTQAERMLQMGITSATPESWSEQYGVFYPDKKTPFRSEDLPLALAIRGISSDGVELFVRHDKLPEGVLLKVDGRPVTDKWGVLCGGVAIFRDITAEKHAEISLRESEQRYRASESHFRSFFENLPIGAYKTTKEGMILDVNDALVRMLGYSTREELLARELEVDFEPQYSRAEFQERIERDGFIHGLEAIWLKRNGELVYLRENARVVRNSDGSVLYYEGTVEDVSERKRIEKEKNELISMVSHELKTPLTVILGNLGIIERNLNPQEKQNLEKAVRFSNQSATRMLRLINDLLDLEKIESGKMSFDVSPILVMPFVEQAMEAGQGYAERMNVRYILKERLDDVQVLADPDMLAHVMSNLLSNAAKFSSIDQPVEIFVRRVGENIRVCIQDYGPGITLEMQEHIFEKFSQFANPSVRGIKGTGLGLSISKAIIEKQGGKIGFETELNYGTRFYFDLPEWKEHTTEA